MAPTLGSTRRRIRALACAIVAAVGAGVGVPTASAAVGESARSYVPGEAIVRFEPGTSADERGDARSAAGVDFERSLRIPRAQLVEVDGGVPSAVRRLERQPDVAYAQPNYRYHALAGPPGWTTSIVGGGVEWGLSDIAASGSHSASDSPAGGYANGSDSRLVRNAGANLTGQRGCRMHFQARYALEDGFDELEAGGVTAAGLPSLVARRLTGSTGGSFFLEEVSIEGHDGSPDVRPWFALLSDGDVTDDGAYVDDVRVLCRDESYVNAIAVGSYDQPGSGNYVRFNGTSMAAPHVAGTAALVRAAVPAASDTQIVDAIKAGGAPLPSLVGNTVTGCTTDALGAIQAADGGPPGSCAAATGTAQPAPDDTFFGDLWGLQDSSPPSPGVNALPAWTLARGAGQVIAVVDTGVDLTHPDIEANLWTGPGGIHGHDFVDDDTVPDDYGYHGTHVAGTAAAIAGNGQGVAGVAPDAQIMAIRALDGNGGGSSADIAQGIDFAAANGADAINLSLGGPQTADPTIANAIAIADAADAVVVAAAGNEASDNDVAPTVPCNVPQPNVICVAAVNQNGDLASFSNFGAASVDVGAPGTSILSAKTDYGPWLLYDGFESSASTPTPPTAPSPAAPTPPARPRLGGTTAIRATRKGVFTYRFRATPQLTGSARFRTAKKVVVSRRARVTIAIKRFAVGTTGKVALKVKLSRKSLRILRSNRKLPLVAKVRVVNAHGLSASASWKFTLKAPRR